MSRRDAFSRILKAAVVLATTGTATVSALGRQDQNPSSGLQQPGPASISPEISTTPPEEIKEIRRKKLNEILATRLDDPQRTLREHEYVSKSRTLEDIDLGLEVCADRQLRKNLLDLRWSLRISGTQSELPQLSREHLDWARRKKIHPEVLAMCIDSYNLWVHTMSLYQQKGVYLNIRPPEDRVITPYGMAILAQTESEGFISIGKYPAIAEINTTDYKEELTDLKKLVQIIIDYTGLDYRIENIPGSENPKTPLSTGGAIGPMQIMPSSALGIGNELNENFFPPIATNPFNIRWALLASSILLAEKGFNVYSDADSEKALLLWNNDKTQAAKVIEANTAYRNLYLKK